MKKKSLVLHEGQDDWLMVCRLKFRFVLYLIVGLYDFDEGGGEAKW